MRRRFNRARKRSVSWISGLSSYDLSGADGVSNRLIAMAEIGAGSNVWGASIGLVIPADLPLQGGEDAVLTRIRGQLAFREGRRDVGAGPAAYGFQMHVSIVQTDYLPPAGTISPWVLLTSVGLGNDNVLWSGDSTVSNSAIGAAGTGYDFQTYSDWLEVDVKAKRKLQEDRMIVIWFQTAMSAATTGVDFRLLGSLRTLLMRPK